MKYFLVLLVGILMGISGEFLIPKTYRYGQLSGCLYTKDIANGSILFFNTSSYQPEYEKPFLYIEDREGFIPSYLYLWAYLNGEFKNVSTEECNKVTEAYLNFQDKTK